MRLLLSLAAVLASAAGSAAAEPATVQAAATPASDTCTMPAVVEPDDAFAHTIDDPRTLAFISYVENIPEKDHKPIIAHQSIPLPPAASADLDRAMASQCIGTETALRSTRLLYSVAKRWSGQDALDLEPAVRLVMATLTLGDRVSADTRDAALANFQTSTDKLDAMLAARQQPPAQTGDSSAACSNVDAHAIKVIQVRYPSTAVVRRVSATIQAKLSLDEHGYVRSVTDYHNAITTGNGIDDLVTETIVAAGSSDYAPEFVACKAVAGAYIFRASFDIR